MRPLESELRAGMDALGVSLSNQQVGQLLDYLALIQKWTRVYNLTAVRDAEEMLTHHLLDSLAVLTPLRQQLADPKPESGAHPSSATTATTTKSATTAPATATATATTPALTPGLTPALAPPPTPATHTQHATQALQATPAANGVPAVKTHLLDVGSGAGLPGVVIAICCPDIQVDCVDTVAKKAAFIQQVAVTLKLANLRGLHARVETLTTPYAVISSRAFASLADFTQWSGAALAEQGIWMAMKGKDPADEIAALPPTVKVFHVEQLQVPGLDAQRCIVWLRKSSSKSTSV